MNIADLKIKADQLIDNIKDNGIYAKENTFLDYKLELKLYADENEVGVFLRNFAKDILAFANKDGGILFLGFKENGKTGGVDDIGLKVEDINILKTIDLKNLSDQFTKMFDNQIIIGMEMFNITARRFYYILIEKHHSTLIPKNDFPNYKLKKGDIIYRGAGNNVHANGQTSEFNTFLESKVNEKNKEFMQIWSSLLPEVFDINPREILIINPLLGRIYGYNSTENILSGTDIEIDNKKDAPFNVILNAISAGEIGKISNNEGKPIYKIMGEMILNTKNKESTTMSSIHSNIKKESKYTISSLYLKEVMLYLRWVTNKSFHVENPKTEDINPDFAEFIWIETIDNLNNKKKVVFSPKAVNCLLEIIKDETKHIPVFGKKLNYKIEKKRKEQ